MRRMLLLVALLGLLAACGDDAEAACGPVVREALDPSSGLHVIAGEDVPDYATDPPTSGAHYSVPPPTGVADEPIERPLQVTILEVGGVLVQHRDLPEADVAALEGLAGDDVVVAPNPDQAEPLVLTAWLTKQTCSGLDLATVEAFTDDHRGRGPGAD